MMQRAKVIAISLALFMSGVFMLFTPIPLFYLSAKEGEQAAFIAALFGGGLVTVLSFLPFLQTGDGGVHLYFTLCHYFFFAVVGITLGGGLYRQLHLLQWIGSAVGWTLAFVIAAALFAQTIGISDVVHDLRSYLSAVVAEVIRLQQTSGGGVALVQEMQEEIVRFVLRIFPSVLIVFALLAVVLNAFVGSGFLQRFKVGMGSGLRDEARQFRLPDGAIWGLIGAGLFFFIGNYLLQSGLIRIISLNALIVLASLYFLQGAAVLSWFLKRFPFPLFRMFFYVMCILFFQLIGPMVVLLGIADVWVDIRARTMKGAF